MFAKGKKAWGICDRTGFRYKLSDLVPEYRNGRPTGLRVGRDQVDKQNPQENPRATPRTDAMSLRDPRPDRSIDSPFGWNPVGNPMTMMRMEVGTVTIDVSGLVDLADDAGNLLTDGAGNTLMGY